MNSTWIKLGIAYTAGMITLAVYQNYNEAGQLKELMSLETDSVKEGGVVAPAGSCACENADRYNVDPKTDSKNIPITKDAECQAMVNGATPSGGGEVSTEPKGAWFSKLTLDLMFCHAPTANGIYVYKGKDAEGQYVYIAEAARESAINTIDDGVATMYYSHTLCPTMCGVCGH